MIDPASLDLAIQIINSHAIHFMGIYSHSGNSYISSSSSSSSSTTDNQQQLQKIIEIANQEKEMMKEFATKLRNRGITIPPFVISIGATPSCSSLDSGSSNNSNDNNSSNNNNTAEQWEIHPGK